MAKFTYRSPLEFKRDFPRDAARVVERAGLYSVGEIHAQMLRELQILTPVGGIVSRDRHPGLMRRSYRASSAAGPKRVGVIINIAPNALIIDMGRRQAQTFRFGRRWFKGKKSRKGNPRSSPHRRRDALLRQQGVAPTGKWLGSKMAPRGVVGPAWRRVQKRLDEVSRRAFEYAERAA